MVKFSDLFFSKSQGGSARRYLSLFRRHLDTLLTSVFVSTTLDGVTSFFSCQQRKKCIHLYSSITAKTVGEISLCDGGKLEESERYNHSFVVFYVLESNRSAFVRDLLRNKSQFVGQL